MKRKLKKLHEVLAMYPNYKVDIDGVNLDRCLHISSWMLRDFGGEIEVESIKDNEYDYKCNRYYYAESWFEPLPERKIWYQVIVHNKGDKRPYRYTYLFESKEDFLKSSLYTEQDFHWIKLIPIEVGE